MAIAVACFGGRWVFPVATMLLALEPRKKKDPVIVSAFAAMFSGKYKSLLWKFLNH